MVGQGLSALAVGAGGDCSDILSLAYRSFLFSLSLSLSVSLSLSLSLSLSGMDGWETCDLSHFQQNFSAIRVGDGWLYAMEFRLRSQRFPPQAGLESGTASLAG